MHRRFLKFFIAVPSLPGVTICRLYHGLQKGAQPPQLARGPTLELFETRGGGSEDERRGIDASRASINSLIVHAIRASIRADRAGRWSGLFAFRSCEFDFDVVALDSDLYS